MTVAQTHVEPVDVTPADHYTRADMARAWGQGYSSRPLYDGQNRGTPVTPNPYEDDA
jgi:hypothetical protein